MDLSLRYITKSEISVPLDDQGRPVRTPPGRHTSLCIAFQSNLGCQLRRTDNVTVDVRIQYMMQVQGTAKTPRSPLLPAKRKARPSPCGLFNRDKGAYLATPKILL